MKTNPLVVTENKQKLSFDNTEIAFKSKTDTDLKQAYWLFKLIASNTLVKIGSPLTNFALKIGLPIKGIIKKTIFHHFCGGETIQDCEQAIESLAEYNVHTILDYSVEEEATEAAFDATCQEILSTIARAKDDPRIPSSVFKPSGLSRVELIEKINNKEELTPSEVQEFERVKQRIDLICRTCYENDQLVLIDAEFSWTQDVFDDIAREMMQKYNHERAIVYNTYQLYRHDKLASLKADFYYADTAGFYLGAKLVRGAYMEIERERAEEKGYPSPIQPDKAASDRDFDAAILFCLDHLDRIGFMAGTHNEASSQLLTEEMNKRAIQNSHSNIYFAQLLGMSDHLSFNLSAAGYNVAKYMPYGPIVSVMPYLMRRAQENTSVAGQTSRELSLITKEIERRKENR